MVARLTKVFDDDTLDELKSAAIRPRGVYNTLYVLANAGVSGGVVEFEASADGVNWAILATRTLTGVGMTSDSITPDAHVRLRARISTVIAGGTIDAWILSAPPAYESVDERDLSSKAAV